MVTARSYLPKQVADCYDNSGKLVLVCAPADVTRLMPTCRRVELVWYFVGHFAETPAAD